MQCIKCVHKIVCKHFSYANDNLHIGIQINDCKFYECNSENNKVQSSITSIANNKPAIQNGFIPPQHSMAETMLLNNSAGYPDFSSLSSKTEPIKAMPVEINKVACDRCKNEVFSTDIDNCSECGRPVCIDCKVSTFDPNLGTVTSVCEKCWSGAEDPTPGEESQISISFEEKKDNWDITDFIDNEEEKENVTREQVEDRKSNRKSKKQ